MSSIHPPDEAISRLEIVATDLADLALDCLRAALDGDESAKLKERKITSSRRAVEKALALLRSIEADPD